MDHNFNQLHWWITISDRVTKKFPFEPSPDGGDGISHVPLWGRDVQADGRACAGPETCLVCSRSNREVRVRGAESQGRMVGREVRR